LSNNNKQVFMNTVDTFLPAIEQPRGLMMRLAYFFTRRQFGKVLTPVAVSPDGWFEKNQRALDGDA